MIKRYQKQIVVGLTLMTVTLACYWQVQHFDFINLDDTDYVTENYRVRAGITGEGIRWAFTTYRSANWHPLTWLSHMMDCELYGLNAMGHHWSNLLFHMANTLLLFLLFNQMTGAVWRSAFVAALFALHPLHVESVAWISERKDVLSTFFGLLSMMAYIRYVEKRHFASYLMCFLFLCIGLMAKPMLVTLPFVLLLLDFWPLGRFSAELGGGSTTEKTLRIDRRKALRLMLEKVPFFILAFLFCIITIIAQSSKGAVQSLRAFSLPVRLSNALVSYARYIIKTIWPDQLSVYYSHPGGALPTWQVACAGFFIATVTFWAFHNARKYPYAAVGWFWFLGTLVPVIGIIQVGGQSMADRYTYIPHVGLFILISWGGSAFSLKRGWGRSVPAVCAVVILSALSIRTFYQTRHWKNSITLYENAIRVDDRSDHVHMNFASALSDRGMFDQAAFHYKKALEINPMHDGARNNLGNLMMDKGNFQEAERHYRKALHYNPENAIIHYNLGVLLTKQNKWKEAYPHFAEAIKLKPDFAEAYNYIGVLLARRGKFKEADVFYGRALQINPDLAKARMNFERNKKRLSHDPYHR